MDNFIFGQYSPGDSFIHRLDPRNKLFLTILIIVASLLIHSWVSPLILLLVCAFAIQTSHVGWHFLIHGIKFFIHMILLTSLLQLLLSRSGKVYWYFWIFNISSFGAHIAIMSFFRFIIAIIISMLFLLTTSPIEISDTISSLLNPLKFIHVPVEDISLTISIALRFVPTMTGEVHRIMDAQKSRGVQFHKGNVIKRIKMSIPIMFPLFINTFKRAEDLASAMILRGYTGNRYRSSIRKMHWHINDTIVFIAIILIIILIFLLIES
ncbi:energy-coupling factor transporter transmembrane protein EcfT [Philodulcilactobacillus myokoensis]|uniref:Energy-coupling factor transporter transmembrane protein EcfT n=1 Tax=Philodulcilactobacillus myokoensis TaxID=2929573 RepID=A0A9W6B2C4_9LACO|nr:energy-coupling factor transporter transmembrane component T [Philodulcilactobacillus myokoensis]GLB47516.1 energy-coupling factor transporter transmembrane protein EcfT [Philodulcilactobacillus myokoensis]